MKNQKRDQHNSVLLLLLSTFFSFIAWQTYQAATVVKGWVSPKLLILVIAYETGLFLVWLVGSLFLYYPQRTKRYSLYLRSKIAILSKPLAVFFLFLPALLTLFTKLVYLHTPSESGVYFPYFRVITFLVSNILAAFFLTKEKGTLLSFSKVALSLLLSSFLLVFIKEFQRVVDYPFSSTWSEGNRIWDYSILFGKERYNLRPGQDIYAFINRGRQTVWGIVFLIPNLTIWGMRLWNAIVFTIPYASLGWLLFPKPQGKHKLWGFVGIWALIFLTQGPIYTPLILSAILVASTRKRSLWIAIPLVGLAGYYAQLTRYTWLFAPAMWAGMWTLGSGTLDNKKNIPAKTWRRSILLVLAGVVGGYLIPYFENARSASVVSVEGISQAVTHHPLIWSRLWPNPTYPPGIVLGLALAVVPLLVLLGYRVFTKRWTLNFWQGLALGFGLFAFLGVGLVVSVKAGGGSNLHNLDMFLIGLLFTAAIAWEKGGAEWLGKLDFSTWPGIVLLAAVALPVYSPLFQASPLELPDEATTQQALHQIQEEVSRAAQRGEVLFMDQRQLLTFGYVEQIPLIDEYEKKVVMNEAQEADEAYFAEFYQYLAKHRFALIINEPLRINYHEEGEHNFAAENNAWVYWVAEPMLCYYEKLDTLEEVKVELLVPRQGEGNCPPRLP